ncbi:MAG: hypothetical protein VX493_02425 [Candidatus Thermoplasmatota archaeon]|nr:hypothetical protein [Euryarchaeota archaeon]MAN00277.1 hypothetical protein [Euryarchaeota archaeon]MBO53690.1 hypothetical protein [Euryarchaeota archaeon]MED5452164.1 hypothetical protein [Candidatus Thermoplasmatota archaeon]
MTESGGHTALNPSEGIAKEANKRVEARSAGRGEPEFHMTDDMRRLSTPWFVALARAQRIDDDSLPAGVILDAAAGSGVQLIAYGRELERPVLGIEKDGNIAVLCAANMHINSKDDELQRTMDRVVIGDGTDSDGAITEYWNSLREAGTRAHPPIAMLHLDPARPTDAQNHDINEMEPSVASVLQGWVDQLQIGPNGPAVLLDLSPRLGEDQRGLVEANVRMALPGSEFTWEWLSQGGGRVDRLSLWIGSLASKSSHRCVRMGRKNVIAEIEGNPANSEIVVMNEPPPYGAHLTIVDPALVQSGLQESWLEQVVQEGSGYSWLRLEGRRPILIHTDPLIESDALEGFVVATGEIVQHRLRPPELHTIDQVASSIAKNGIGKITLRCSLDPDVHPTIQRRLDRELKPIEGSKGFMVDIDLERPSGTQSLYVVCKE